MAYGGRGGHGGRHRPEQEIDPRERNAPSSRARFAAFRERLKQKKVPPSKGDESSTQLGKDGAGPGAADPAKPVDRAVRRGYMREYASWLRPHRGGLLLVFSLALVGSAVSLIQPLVFRYVIDGVVLNADLQRAQQYRLLAIVGSSLIGAMLVNEALNLLRSYRMGVLDSRLMFWVRRRLLHKMLRLPLKELSDMKTGGAISRLSSDVEAFTGLISTAVINPSIAVLRLVATLSILVVLNWRLAVAAAATIPFMALLSYSSVRRIRPIWRGVHDDMGVVNGRLTEMFNGIRVVRGFRREHREECEYAVGQHTIIRKHIFARILSDLLHAAWGLLLAVTGVLIVCFGGVLVVRGQASVGDLIAFQTYTLQVLRPVFEIVSSVSRIQRSLAAMERVMDVMDRDIDKPDVADAVAAVRPTRQLSFEDVGFAYEPGKPVLHAVNITIRVGQTVAVVGKSGAGKTTMADLIARFYDPQEGKITLDGVDVRHLQLRSYRDLVGLVQQDVFLFDGTVRDNIAYARPAAGPEAVCRAAQRANADAFIDELPDGYDTVIGERGVRLSGGQRQRISIARAFLADPAILILDEATSNLDTESEQLIVASLRELMRTRTTFVIAHRLSTVTHADLILVMEEGKILERGTHAELVAQGGLYHDMIERQRRLTL